MKGLIPFFFFLPFVLGADPIVTAHVDRTTANLGDLVTLTLDLHFEQGWDFDLVPLESKFGDAKVHSSTWSKAQKQPESGLEKVTMTASLSWYELGKQVIPAITIKGSNKENQQRTFETSEIEMEIIPTLQEGEQTPSDSKPQIMMRELPLWVIGVLIIIALAVIAWLMWRKFKKSDAKRQQEAPPIPPLEEVMARMKVLIGSSVLKEGNYKPFYVQINLIIRHFLGRVFNMPGEEMTSFELEEFFRNVQVPGEFLENQSDFDGLCDRVKFAKYEPSEAENTEVVNLAYQLIQHLKPMCKQEEPDVETR